MSPLDDRFACEIAEQLLAALEGDGLTAEDLIPGVTRALAMLLSRVPADVSDETFRLLEDYLDEELDAFCA